MSAPQQLCEVAGEYNGTTNIRRLSLYYSLKNHKWIKGYVDGNRVHGAIRYRLYPGRYVYCYIYYWSKQDPPFDLTCREIVLVPTGNDSCKEEIVMSRGAMFYSRESGMKYFAELGLPMVVDLIAWTPGYHSGIYVDFNKTYGEEATKKFIDWIENGKSWIEGAENE